MNSQNLQNYRCNQPNPPHPNQTLKQTSELTSNSPPPNPLLPRPRLQILIIKIQPRTKRRRRRVIIDGFRDAGVWIVGDDLLEVIGEGRVVLRERAVHGFQEGIVGERGVVEFGEGEGVGLDGGVEGDLGLEHGYGVS
ncbi:hypothetical protein GB937_007750 [Aspergillus fischeri]|nr:hypothetical protein GB937_007750 [Aspergillus fischeri]